MRLRIATRSSHLARAQTEQVAADLAWGHPRLQIEIVEIRTVGDRVIDLPLPEIGGKGVFTAELEAALRAGDADLAVHSLKDLPTELPEDLAIAAVTAREDPHDAWISRDGVTLDEIPDGALVGTSSLRRRAQLLRARPGLDVRDLRGNVPTRLRRLDAGTYDAIVLAAAGLRRLGLHDRIVEKLEPPAFLPAPGQGAVAIETRAGDAATRRVVATIDHAPTRLATGLERDFLARLGGGCHAPIGALATFEGSGVRLEGLVASTDGRRSVRTSAERALDDAAGLGTSLADAVLRAGGRAILEAQPEIGS